MSSFAASAPLDIASLLNACRLDPDPCPLVCAWCKETIRAGNPAKPISHGICEACDLRLEADLAAVEVHHVA